jgi:hypothetical protein
VIGTPPSATGSNSPSRPHPDIVRRRRYTDVRPMLDLNDIVMLDRGTYYLIGAFIVAVVVFVTAARRPNPQCKRCREHNRPNAKYCAYCGQRLAK